MHFLQCKVTMTNTQTGSEVVRLRVV